MTQKTSEYICLSANKLHQTEEKRFQPQMEWADEPDFLQKHGRKKKWTAKVVLGWRLVHLWERCATCQFGDQSDPNHYKTIRDWAKASSVSLHIWPQWHVSFPDIINASSSNYFFSITFVPPCLKSNTVKCGSKKPQLIPTADLQQPKYNNVLTTVIQIWIWTRIFQTKASISHYHDLCQPGFPLNLFPLNLQGRK